MEDFKNKIMPKKTLKCFAKKYTEPVWFRGALICLGGFGQPACPFLQKCIEQYREFGVPEKSIKRALKRFVKDIK